MGRTINPEISIIVPTLNEKENLSRLLSSLFAWQELGDEVILVDGGSSDDTLKQAKSADIVIETGRGRGIQMNIGTTRCSGRILWFLHADSTLQFHAREDILDSISQGFEWGYFDVRIDASERMYRVIERGMNLRSRYTRIATGDQGMFVTKSLFDKVGGFKDIPLMEDVDLSKRLRMLGRPAICQTTITTSPRRWRQGGIFRTILTMWFLRLAWFFGIPAERLAKIYDDG